MRRNDADEILDFRTVTEKSGINFSFIAVPNWSIPKLTVTETEPETEPVIFTFQQGYCSETIPNRQ